MSGKLVDHNGNDATPCYLREHPERKRDECFVGNVKKGESKKWYPEFKTTREGNQAFDGRGRPTDISVPVFVKAKEFYAVRFKDHGIKFEDFLRRLPSD